MQKVFSIFILSFIAFLAGCRTVPKNVKMISHRKPNVGDLVVAQDGSGQFKTIQAAIESIQDTTAAKQRVIFIKNGTYEEKIFLQHKDQITLRGESENGVIITQSIARDIFRCENKNDWGVATINMRHADDITIEHLTAINRYGFEAKGDMTVPCANDPTKEKVVRKSGHQMALRTFHSTKRLVVRHATFRAFGGDTVSPWDLETGSYYFADVTMEGGVDFYCPRGWAFAERIRFIGHNNNASIWHDGTGNPDKKSVIVDSKFNGDDGFALGRYHREAQIYLIRAEFADNMADRAIYEVPNTPTPPQWGHRIYYSSCARKSGKDFYWHTNNLDKAPTAPKESDITTAWTFGGNVDWTKRN